MYLTNELDILNCVLVSFKLSEQFVKMLAALYCSKEKQMSHPPTHGEQHIRWVSEHTLPIIIVLNHHCCDPKTTCLVWFSVMYTVLGYCTLNILCPYSINGVACVSRKSRPLMQYAVAQGRVLGLMIGWIHVQHLSHRKVCFFLL